MQTRGISRTLTAQTTLPSMERHRFQGIREDGCSAMERSAAILAATVGLRAQTSIGSVQ
jgi:hypothetical protein